MYCAILVLVIFFVTICVGQISPYPEVTIQQGIIRGKYDTTINGRSYAAFIGIPYAQARVGKQKFKEPKASKPWVGILFATEKRPVCLQYDQFTNVMIGDEDCLYLDIYTPSVPVNAQTSRLLDVIVYINGEGFTSSSGNDFGPNYLLDRDVVFVTFNYRVGALGFLSTGDLIVPGNNGLKDQSAALRWVQRNIAAFGGNPGSITLIGHGAGGASVHYHYLSPLSQGLFTRGISFSGTALCPWALMENGREKAFQIGTNLGCNTLDSTLLLNCLRNRPAHQILQQSKQLTGWSNNPFAVFGPTVELGGKIPFITQEPYQILKSGLFQQLPWITSVTSEEGLFPGAEIISSPTSSQELDLYFDEILPHILDFNQTVEPELKQDVCSDIRGFYFNNLFFTNAPSQNPTQVVKMLGDRHFVSCAEEAAKTHAELSIAPVYFYYFSYKGSTSMSNMYTKNEYNIGVSHGDDVAYFLKSTYLNPENSASDKEMMNRFLDFITSYASFGIPRFTPNFVFAPVKPTLPALQYINIKSPTEFVPEQSTNLGNSEFWFNLPLYEEVNLVKLEPMLVENTTPTVAAGGIKTEL
uniref:Carboxylesterase type B domain-containing protein n=1 Tax=Clastoptera arizonana TaxID=38151 RepID=A0A1B6D1F0_9HEMI